MSLWTPLQRDCLEGMGFEVMRLRGQHPMAAPLAKPAGTQVSSGAAANDSLQRAARGVDLAALLADVGRPVDAGGRRAFWRRLRPLRKAARGA